MDLVQGVGSHSLMKEFGNYPVDQYLEAISNSLNESNAVVLSAEPGAGKTTRVPIYLKDKVEGLILVLEPRRLAAKLSADRCSYFLDEEVGESVGFQIRHEKKLSPDTRVLFITEGLFVRLLQSNPFLEGIGAVILDEFHERNIHTDIALGLVQQLMKSKRPDLKLLVMSATMDCESISSYLGNCPIFDIEGRVYPLTIEYREFTNLQYQTDRIVAGITDMIDDQRCTGNVLVFLTGIGEIRQVASQLKAKGIDQKIEIIPLSADLPPEKQRQAFVGDNRKIILSTNVAETSLTIPNVTGVVDSGYAKVAGVAPWSGMPTLEVMRVSRASAEQRAGRAGRTSPGLVFRIYSKGDYVTRSEFTAPEIECVDLSHMVLDLLSLDLSLENFPWFERPLDEHLNSAIKLLIYLEAIDSKGALTDFGRELATIPMHPRHGTLILAGRELGILEDAALAACMISEGMVSKLKCDNNEYSCDLSYQIDLLREALTNSKSYAHHLLDRKRVDRVLRLYDSFSLVTTKSKKLGADKADSALLSQALLRAYPDRIAVKRKLEGKKTRVVLYNFCMGKGGSLWEGSALSHHYPDYFIAIDAMERLKGNAAKGITVRYGSRITLDQLKEDPAGLISTEVKSELNEKRGTMRFFSEITYGKLVIERKKGAESSVGEDVSLFEMLKSTWPYPFNDLSDLDNYHARLNAIESAGIEHSFPRFEGEMLDLFIEELAIDIESLSVLTEKTLTEHIESQLSSAELIHLNYLAPKELKASNGKVFRVNYSLDKDPWVSSLVQHFYGIEDFPKICDEKVALHLVLLAPNQRPAQITSDLRSFWMGSYTEVSKELSRRYPKHYWPEYPSASSPLILKKMARDK